MIHGLFNEVLHFTPCRSMMTLLAAMGLMPRHQADSLLCRPNCCWVSRHGLRWVCIIDFFVRISTQTGVWIVEHFIVFLGLHIYLPWGSPPYATIVGGGRRASYRPSIVANQEYSWDNKCGMHSPRIIPSMQTTAQYLSSKSLAVPSDILVENRRRARK